MIKELTFFSLVLLLLVRNKLHETHTLEFISSKTKTRALLLHHFFLSNFKSKTWTKSSPLLKTQLTDLTDYPQNANVGRSSSNLILALQTILPPSLPSSLKLLLLLKAQTTFPQTQTQNQNKTKPILSSSLPPSTTQSFH
jgi:hypothetical protein